LQPDALDLTLLTRTVARQRREIMLNPNRRTELAAFWAAKPPAPQTPNADEASYPDRRGSFSKGLPHNALGEVDPSAYNAMVTAVTTKLQSSFNGIPLGGASDPMGRRLTNPQNGLGVELIGPDPTHLAIPPAPPFASAEIAAEIVENYWMAITRDVHFADYGKDALIQQAATDLDGLGSLYQGPRDGSGAVVPQLLFRGTTPGENVGPYVSQFLLQDCFFGAQQIDQRMQTVVAGKDYMLDFATWLEVQRGFGQPKDMTDPTLRYIRNGRDLGQWVHVDVLYQAYFNAMLILINGGARLDTGHPYRPGGPITKEDAFGSLGGPHLQSLVPEVARRALRAVWYQKWAVHRRLRPEVFAGRVHLQRTGAKDYGINPVVMSGSSVLDQVEAYVEAQTGNSDVYLLPMAFPEGSPIHPAYGAGHATVASACVTVLKAWFDTSQNFAELINPRTGASLSPVVASADGSTRDAYTGPDAAQITVATELNKLAANIGLGRNLAGVHWRSDHTESIKLGEAIAIGTLRDYIGTFNEGWERFYVQKFDGSFVAITGDGEVPQ
jgi:hypothetical protein